MSLRRKILLIIIGLSLIPISWLGILVYKDYAYQKDYQNKAKNYKSIGTYKNSAPTPSSEALPNKANSVTNSTDNEQLFSGCFQQTGYCYKNITKTELDRTMEEQKAIIESQSTPRPYPSFDYQIPDISAPTPSQVDLDPYMPYIRFDTPVPTPTKPPCPKVFKSTKFKCIQAPDCVCN